MSSENGPDLRQNLIYGDGGEAFLLFDDAGFEIATPAIDLVVKNTMLFSVGKPDPRLVTSSEDSHAGYLDRGGKMHGTAVMPKEDAGEDEHGGTLAWSESTAQVDYGQ